MAGERKGKTYEAILKVALDKMKNRGKPEGEIFWNKAPKGMTIEPDFTIGRDQDHPSHLFLVTHSGSAAESHKKLWRNIGELAEAKLFLSTVPRVYNIAFDSIIKEDLKKIQEASFDGQLIVGDLSYGTELLRWVEENHDRLPSRGEDKAMEIAKRTVSDKRLADLYKHLMRDLDAMLGKTCPELDQLWTSERSRIPGKAPRAKETVYRRGFAKALVFGAAPIEAKKPVVGAANWLVKLGIVKKTIGGFRVTDSDLLWVANSPLASLKPSEWPKGSMSQGFQDQIRKVKSLALLVEFERYVAAHLSSLRTVKGMEAHLTTQYGDPSHGLTLPSGVSAPTNVWLFDFIGALVKAKAGKSQSFGYSTFSKHPSSTKSRIGNMDIGTWCSCFMNQFFTRRIEFSAPKEAIKFVSTVLSEELAKFSVQDISSLAESLEKQYIAKEYEATLLAHNGFDPIGGLIKLKAKIGDARELRIRACFAEYALSGGGSGATSVLQVGSTVINWQSAHGSHTNDKRKELCGRAVGIRYSWNDRAKRFVPRVGVKKLVLVVDGTWRQDDLDALVRAGWDEILYPDQLGSLAKAII